MRPLGYWIKEIDRRIEASFARDLADEDLTRRQWQVLHTIAEGAGTVAELDRALAPFLSRAAGGVGAVRPQADQGAPVTVRPQVEELAGREWVVGTVDGAVALTDPGREAHERVAGRVRETRARVVEGLSDADYVALVGTLERIAGNLAA